MIHAAGILIISDRKRALFLKRGPGGDYPGAWCFPGGRAEGEESPLDAAVRETEEETGWKPPRAKLAEWTRTQTPQGGAGVPEGAVQPEDVDFVTFALTGVKEFEPKIDESGEHTAYAWAPINEPPQPLHPGAQISLARFDMTETDVAKAISAGTLTSPQRFENITMFGVRVTGTGKAYRGEKVDPKTGRVVREEEIAVRDPGIYLNPEFLERVAGLPVVLEHPPGLMLDGKEFSERIVGTLVQPSIKGDEVWAVAKVYDEEAATLMQEHQLSTSPGVVWRGAGKNTEAVIDGKNYFIEGKPSLLDHLAICWQGVWDKGGEPTGVDSVTARGDDAMTAEEIQKAKEEEAAFRKSLMESVTAISTSLKETTARLDSVEKRFDEDDKKKEEESAKDRKDSARSRADNFAFSKRNDGEDDESYKKRHDAEEDKLRADMEEGGEDKEKAAKDAKSRRDAFEEKERKDAEDEEKERKDSVARKDSADELAALRRQNEELTSRLDAVEGKTKTVSDEEAAAFGKFQARADSVYTAMGGRAPRPLLGESLVAYKRRVATELKPHTKWKDAEMGVIAANDAAFTTVVDHILDDVLAQARSDASVPAGTLREIEETLPGGHKSRRFMGDPAVWMGDFAPGMQFMKKLGLSRGKE